MSARSLPGEAITVVRPSRGWVRLDLAEIWRYRELLAMLVWRDLKVRYAQTLLGAAWAVLQPLLMMVIFTIFFGRLARIPTPVAYPVFALTALVPWTYFAGTLTLGSNSLVNQSSMITKIYFPRLLLPLATCLSGVVDLLLGFVLLLGMMALYGVWPGWAVLTAPAFVLLALLTSLGANLWLSALNVLYRDVRYTVPFLVQLWLFASPVIYPSDLVAQRFPRLYPFYLLNPMAGVIHGFRWALLGLGSPPRPVHLLSLLSLGLLLLGGLVYFRRMERIFADVI